MARMLTLERQGLALEAKNLREFGYTQQQIAEALGVPRQSLGRWLKIVGNGKPDKMGNSKELPTYPLAQLPTMGITLYPCRYEEAAGLIPDDSIDLIVTDPPYLVSNNDISRNNQADLQRNFGQWDNVPDSQYKEAVAIWASLMSTQLKQGASLYVFIGFRQSRLWHDAFDTSGLQFGGLLLWHRVNPAPQIRKTRWCPAFDLILYFTKGPPKTFVWMGQNEMHNVITGPICAGNEREYHPTQKPRWLLQKLLQVSSKPGDTVLDPFAGTGSTAFAVGHLPRRRFILVEPEPKYSGLIQSIAQEEFQCKVTIKNA
ncbi:DNA methyltransferase [Candidatus Magnetobacterium casense]|uniref:Helix-turn-helix domain-containing protein n=1 Tax=Candidatus Magnetobacterium casense TaxID=1455061 RepID=A0ABS6S308_9BACT|nr:DNA methyltransferase [Candidatus Magnetobacterium casensis]MBV6343234.1 helix-turn-helix domain-containing protein [Candidatus Magnetobacterium casensis]